VIGMNFIKEDMKSLSLSQEQKHKLLEMCKKLFPEYNFELVDFSGGDHRNSVYALRIKESVDNPVLDVCWFELCQTYMADKLAFLKEDSRSGIIKEIEFYRINENMHLVDYLYEEFKKFK